MERKLDNYDEAYSLGNPLISDQDYDKLVEEYELKTARKWIPKNIGNQTENGIKMWSLDKFNDDKSIKSFLKKNESNEFFISDKLDGISALYTSDNKLYTRSGNDISYFLKYMNLPKLNFDGSVRGELVFKNTSKVTSKDTLNSASKVTSKESQAVVSGIFNIKEKNINDDVLKKLSKVHFVVFEVIFNDQDIQLSPQKQFKFISKEGFEVPFFKKVNSISLKKLKKMLQTRLKNSQFQIDGIVITLNKDYIRENNKNPSYSFAFKDNSTTFKVNVESMTINYSRYGVPFPVLNTTPLNLNGKLIKKVSGKNLEYIKKNKIGKGSIIELIYKSSPSIKSVVSESSNPFKCDFKIDHKRVKNSTNIKMLSFMFKNSGVKGLGESVAEKLVDNGYTIPLIRPNRFIENILTKTQFNLLMKVVDKVEKSDLDDKLFLMSMYPSGIGKKIYKKVPLKSYIDYFNGGDFKCDLSNVTCNKLKYGIDLYKSLLKQI